MKTEKSITGKSYRFLNGLASRGQVIELITLDGNVSKKARVKSEQELKTRFGCCSGLFFYKIIKKGVVMKTGKILL